MLVSFLIFGKKTMLQISELLESFQHAPPSEILWWFDAIWNRLLGPWNISAGCTSANYAVHDDLAFTNFVAIVGNQGFFLLHANPWIPGGGTSIFMVVIHRRRSPLHHFGHARTIDEHVVTIQITHVTPQINCGDVTMLSQKDRPWRQWLTRKAILAMIFIRDFITRDNHCQMASFVTKCRYSR